MSALALYLTFSPIEIGDNETKKGLTAGLVENSHRAVRHSIAISNYAEVSVASIFMYACLESYYELPNQMNFQTFRSGQAEKALEKAENKCAAAAKLAERVASR